MMRAKNDGWSKIGPNNYFVILNEDLKRIPVVLCVKERLIK